MQNLIGLVLNLIVLILICNLAEGALQYVKVMRGIEGRRDKKLLDSLVDKDIMCRNTYSIG